MGQTRKKQLFRVKSAFTAEADIFPCPNDVGFGPIADIRAWLCCVISLSLVGARLTARLFWKSCLAQRRFVIVRDRKIGKRTKRCLTLEIDTPWYMEFTR